MPGARRPERHPLEYPVNRLLTRVGMALNSTLLAFPLQRAPEARAAAERLLAEEYHLDWAVSERLLAAYRFQWDDRGALLSIELTPHISQRRVPGLGRIKALFWGGAFR